MDAARYRGWTRPGPFPPGGVEPEEEETLDAISGNFKIFQYRRGHRFSTDDVLAAWYGTQWAPRVDRAADLGSGIGSVALVAAWRLPGARFVTVEAQGLSVRLARKSIRYNGLEDRITIIEGDFRDPSFLAAHAPFDLVLGSPPYWAPGTATPSATEQAVRARMETRGSVADYANAAARVLSPGGVFAFVFPTAAQNRVEAALADAGLVRVRSRSVIFRESEPPRITLFLASRGADLPPGFSGFDDPPLIIRRTDGTLHPEYATLRLSFGYPPDVSESSE